MMSKRKLEVPSSILSLFNSKVARDSGKDHENRVRSFPHLEGNWSTTCFLKIEDNLVWEPLIMRCQKFLSEFADLHPVKDLHISLSKTFPIRYHWMEPLVTSIKKKLLGYYRFYVTFKNIAVFTNEEKTRTFVCIEVDDGFAECLKISKKLDSCFTDYRLPTFYEEPSFHVSILWALGNKRDILSSKVEELQSYLRENEENTGMLGELISEIVFSSGNKLVKLPL